ncbi:MAG: hypothetical protein HOV81_16430, partial [Kofleriaceae bacterium]|nr:hypothetical protein [Kofleriaceae bacterium]
SELEAGGLVNMRGRLYDPVVGRFTTPDPFIQAPADMRSHNRYSYVWNNPINATDPSGFWADNPTGGWGGDGGGTSGDGTEGWTECGPMACPQDPNAEPSLDENTQGQDTNAAKPKPEHPWTHRGEVRTSGTFERSHAAPSRFVPIQNLGDLSNPAKVESSWAQEIQKRWRDNEWKFDVLRKVYDMKLYKYTEAPRLKVSQPSRRNLLTLLDTSDPIYDPAVNNSGYPDDFFVIVGHGYKDTVDIYSGPEGARGLAMEVVNPVNSEHAHKYVPGTPVLLMSCWTGADDDGFAQQLASALGQLTGEKTAVVAPNRATQFSADARVLYRSYYEPGPDGTPVLVQDVANWRVFWSDGTTPLTLERGALDVGYSAGGQR